MRTLLAFLFSFLFCLSFSKSVSSASLCSEQHGDAYYIHAQHEVELGTHQSFHTAYYDALRAGSLFRACSRMRTDEPKVSRLRLKLAKSFLLALLVGNMVAADHTTLLLLQKISVSELQNLSQAPSVPLDVRSAAVALLPEARATL